MYVIGTMAGTATAIEGRYFGQRASMTVLTDHVCVRALEREIGLHIVIEHPKLPCHGVVTRVALLMKVTVVRIVVAMAGITGGLDIGKRLRFVTVFAFVVGMFAEQRERGQIMVEIQRILPVDFRMTCFALCPQCAVVRVVVEMACITTRHQRHVENRFDVAICTCDVPVTAKQPVIGVPVMIEKRFGPVVISVAAIALFTVVAAVVVILRMTRNACGCHVVIERIVRMTVVARQLGMSAE